ncbi:MAG: hypothetical protein WD378_10070, partial [Egicoccus sp.]
MSDQDPTTGDNPVAPGGDALRRELQQLHVERGRLKQQADQLGELVVEREQLLGRVERLERSLAGERERNQQLRFQRDRYRHQAASLRARRWWRLGAALAQAKRDPSRLPKLPLVLLRVLFGAAVKPDVPPPLEPGEARGETDDVNAAQLVSPVDTRPALRLETRYLKAPRALEVTELRVAAVVDTFTESSFEPDCDLVTFRPDNWHATLADEHPHLLLVESAWKGNGGGWEYQVGSYSYPQSVGLPH